MSFRTRLYLFFAIIVIAPVAAVGIVFVSAATGTDAGEADARLAQGFRTAFRVYEDERAEARRRLAAVATDPAVTRAIRARDFAALEDRADELVRAEPELVSVAFYDGGGRPVARAGSREPVAAAAAAPTDAGARRLGTLVVSSTSAADLARRVERLSALEVQVGRSGRALFSTLPGAPAGAESGDMRVGERRLRARFEQVGEPVGPPVRLGLLEPYDPGPLGGGRVATAAVLLGLLLLLLGAAVLVVRTLQEQIGRLLEAARGLRSGDFSQQVRVTGDDRFAALGAEFNAMSQELAAKVEEVERRRGELDETIRRVGEAFALGGLDREGIVDLAVRQAVEACSANAGRAIPIDAEKMTREYAGDESEQFAAALEAAERDAFAAGPDEGVELLQRLNPEEVAPSERRRTGYANLGGVHALAVPMRARITAHSHFPYLGLLSIARRGQAFTDAEVELFSYLSAQAAISIENAHMNQRREQQAITDELTGLYNVRHFSEFLHTEVERSRRYSTEVGLVMIDIDDFKQVNDTHGHQQGDLVLREVARVLQNLSRDVDEPARYGGEELAVVLPQTDAAGAAGLAERIRLAVASLQIRRLDGRGSMGVTASFGVAALPESAADEESLVAAADAALYRAKRSGKNRVARAEPAAAAR